VIDIPEPYSSRRAVIGFDEVAYGVGGVELYQVGELEGAQIGYSVDTNDRSLVGSRPGSWSADWIVISRETACGDPMIFISAKPPYPVFTAMYGESVWIPEPVAPSIERFREWLAAFKRFAAHRGSPDEAEANPPDGQETEAFLEHVDRLCDGNAAAVEFWTTQAEIGMVDEE
jgi:hypothetical protein